MTASATAWHFISHLTHCILRLLSCRNCEDRLVFAESIRPGLSLIAFYSAADSQSPISLEPSSRLQIARSPLVMFFFIPLVTVRSFFAATQSSQSSYVCHYRCISIGTSDKHCGADVIALSDEQSNGSSGIDILFHPGSSGATPTASTKFYMCGQPLHINDGLTVLFNLG